MLSTIKIAAVADNMDQLQNLHACYHKQWWCRLQMFNYFKRCHATFNMVTLVILALSIVVGSVWKERFQEIFTQDGHVSVCPHDLRKDFD